MLSLPLIARSVLPVAIALALGACSVVPGRDLQVAADQDTATVRGFETARAWADGPLDSFKTSLASPRLVANRDRDINYLALSAGGAAGAFTVGVLNGWSDSGARPNFDIVTGVSIGALIAPFAFLGSDYDATLADIFLKEDMTGLASVQNPLKVLLSGGVMDPEPLRLLIERYADDRLLAAVAAEHRTGRRLLAVTTNLDAQRPVVWNLGAIAASGRPDALRVFRDVLMASASVPGAYPPVLIDAESGGRGFKEMHVDGATTEEVFIAPELLPTGTSSAARRRTHIWAIINNTLSPEFAPTKVGTLSIAARSLMTLSKSQTIWVVKAAQEKAARSGMDFNVAHIDHAVSYDTTKPFAADYMRTVFKLGHEGIVNHTLWQKSLAPFARSAVADAEQPTPH